MIQSIRKRCRAARTRGWTGRLGLALNPCYVYVKATERSLFTSSQLKGVICDSGIARDEVKKHFDLSDEKLPLICNCVDTSVNHPDLRKHRDATRACHGIPADAAVFLFVGSGNERMGMPALRQVMAGLTESSVLLVVGLAAAADGGTADTGGHERKTGTALPGGGHAIMKFIFRYRNFVPIRAGLESCGYTAYETGKYPEFAGGHVAERTWPLPRMWAEGRAAWTG